MFKSKWAGWLILASFLWTACSPVPPAVYPPPEPRFTVENPLATMPSQPTELPVPLPAAAEEARKSVASEQGLALSGVKVLSAEAVDWPDSCLGAPKPNEDCAGVVTPGFLIRLEAGGNTIEIHSDQTGGELRRAEAGGSADEPSINAIALLARLAGLKTAETRVVRIEQRDWPDACLGAPNLGEACAAVITPGFFFELRNGNDVYWLHTNQEIRDGRVAGPQNTLIGLRVRLQASKIAGLPLEDLKVSTVESVEWPNSCLGIDTPGVMCLDAITPGYKVVVLDQQRRLVFHTNRDATSVVIEK